MLVILVLVIWNLNLARPPIHATLRATSNAPGPIPRLFLIFSYQRRNFIIMLSYVSIGFATGRQKPGKQELMRKIINKSIRQNDIQR